MDGSETSKIYINVTDHVINKTRSELVSNGKLNLSLLNEIHATWKMKMIQAGVISGALETSVSKPVTVHDHPLQTQDPNLLPEYAQSGIEIDAKVPSMELEMFIENEHEGFCIPQKDGSGDGDAADIKPNTNAPFDEDDEELNENDDDVEEGGGIDDDVCTQILLHCLLLSRELGVSSFQDHIPLTDSQVSFIQKPESIPSFINKYCAEQSVLLR